ncbi:elongation factor P maturation arginine rhamnosyltransferase EarP [Ideonella sp. DXS29W]|uniref:Protein-arginine rhamnosyltransferase n=1 Tax=Ideonella lacteola TaxID=2984193 RepID=A0ABU9BI17_9BURK
MLSASPSGLRWDLFCRVVDNFGDIGVCWRLAADLASRGHRVRLWVDDATALAWLAPQGLPGIEVIHWSSDCPILEPGDVVVEAFGCDPPEAFVRAMASRTAPSRPPVWINLEYLSAEDYVERSHRLPSPQFNGPGAGLTKWFFYPGFTSATGGLLREPGLLARQARFDAKAWLAGLGVERRPGERLVSLFCYAAAPVASWLERLGDIPTLLLATPGHAARLTKAAQAQGVPGTCRIRALPWLSQPDYDHLLWACDLNVVRGEDSFVRAQWAGRPFVWNIYPQDDGAHIVKLDAFLDRYLAAAAVPLAGPVRAWMHAWNAADPVLPASLPDLARWQGHSVAWRDTLLGQTDLCTQLLEFVTEKR